MMAGLCLMLCGAAAMAASGAKSSQPASGPASRPAGQAAASQPTPVLNVVMDRARMAAMGVSEEVVVAEIRQRVADVAAGRQPPSLEGIYVVNNQGAKVPLASLVTVRYELAAPAEPASAAASQPTGNPTTQRATK
jgi:hypothetical protein